MELTTALVVCVGMVVAGATLSSMVRSFKPAPVQPRAKKDRFDLIEEELIRLHDELGNFSEDETPEWIGQEIARLNTALSEK